MVKTIWQNKDANSSPHPEGLGFCFAKQGGIYEDYSTYYGRW
jgi:hypothetical protein